MFTRSTKVHVVIATAYGQHPYGEGTKRDVTYGTVRRWIKVAGSHDGTRYETSQDDDPLPGCRTITVHYHNNGLPIRARFIVYPRQGSDHIEP